MVTELLLELEILQFECKRDGITDGQTDGRTDGQTDRRTDDPNTRCPRRTFQAGGIKICMNTPYHNQFDQCIVGHTCWFYKMPR